MLSIKSVRNGGNDKTEPRAVQAAVASHRQGEGEREGETKQTITNN